MNNSQTGRSRSGPWIITGLVVLLLILHQDNWFWNDDTLLLGFLPIGLFWHACISIGATLTWYLATKIAWPQPELNPAENVASQQAATDRGEDRS